MRFTKSTGANESESILADLCEKSFLTLWTYPNLFRAPAKELSDLLVVFKDRILIFSDKCCQYPNTGDPQLDWQRWYRRSVSDSAAQIKRAENWLKQHPTKVYLDAKCKVEFPLCLPPLNQIRFHRICIALGASERAKTATGTAALKICPAALDGERSFTIGKTSGANGWVHVFGEAEIRTLLAELSTASDFVDYLTKKEELLDSDQFIEANCETDLLAYFLWHRREFKLQSPERFKLQPNLWEKVQSNASFLVGREANNISFFWDNLIEYLNDLYMKEQLEHGNSYAPTEHEKIVRTLAAENRFSRRLLAKWILERAEKAPNSYVSSCHPSINQPDVLYVLLVGPGAKKSKYAEYREHRSRDLTLRCYAAKAASPTYKTIVGIGLDANGVNGHSEDFVRIDTSDWTAEDLSRAEKIRTDFGYFVLGKATQTRLSEFEYPGQS